MAAQTTGEVRTGFEGMSGVVTVDVPPTQPGDWVVLAVRGQTADSPGVSVPGMTLLSAPLNNPTGSASRTHAIFGAYITEGSPAPATVTATVSLPAPGSRAIASCFVVRGASSTAPVLLTSAYVQAEEPDPPPYRMKVPTSPGHPDSALVVLHVANELVSSTPTTPTPLPSPPWTVVSSFYGGSEGASKTAHVVAAVNVAPDGTYPPGEVGWQTNAGMSMDAVVFYPAAGPGAPAPLSALVLPGESGGLHVRDVDGTVKPVTAATFAAGPVIPQGRLGTVQEMIATPGVTWAHRGGSGSWPEMSMHAYTQSCLAGYSVLEVSVGCTSDGVLFGLHDDSINRTSGLPADPALKPSTLTWAQVRSYQITVGGGDPQPYMALDDLFALYGHTHLLMVDPKYMSDPDLPILFSKMDELGPERVIFKQWGPGFGSQTDALDAWEQGRTQTYERWGHFWRVSLTDGSLAANQHRWTLLGFEWNAPQSEWDTILAYGKPVYAFIAPSQAAYDTAMARGAAGVQVSAVSSVAAVPPMTGGLGAP